MHGMIKVSANRTLLAKRFIKLIPTFKPHLAQSHFGQWLEVVLKTECGQPLSLSFKSAMLRLKNEVK